MSRSAAPPTIRDMGPGPFEFEAMQTLGLIVAEFKSDPMSVQCFDLRLVQKATEQVEAFEKRHARFFREHGRDPARW